MRSCVLAAPLLSQLHLEEFMNQQLHWISAFHDAVWCLYLLAAFALPIHHLRPILQYMRGSGGIGDACLRTEALQCLWRVPALMFATFVAPSLPLFLSIFLDLLGRIGRVLAMRVSLQRWQADRTTSGLLDSTT